MGPARRRALKWMPLLLACCSLLAGCSRGFWRQQVDRDVYDILDHRRSHPQWNVPRIDVEPHPLSRFYDPYVPDHGPLPPDDPAAHASMHRADGWNGYAWQKYGRTPTIENPYWLEPFGISAEEKLADETVSLASYPGDESDDGLLLADGSETASQPHAVATGYNVAPQELPPIDDLTIQQAVKLANRHNREYQTRIEDTYLAALDLTFERFQFGVRYLGLGGEPSLDTTGRVRPGGDSELGIDGRFGVSQLLPTGAQWAVELANNTLVLFQSPDRATSTSVLSYSLVQPLLFGAGRRVVLESLTQAERNVLYAIRDLARFRREFFTDIVSSGGGGGFLGLLQQQQTILNQEDNIRRLVRQVERLRTEAEERSRGIVPLETLPGDIEFPPELEDQVTYDADNNELQWFGQISDAQAEQLLGLSDDADYQRAVNALVQEVRAETVTLEVAQLESRLVESRQRLRSLRASFADSLDQYKIFLGLPPDMPLSIDTDLLDQFQLIDPKLQGLQEEIERFVERPGELDPMDPELEGLRGVVSALTNFSDEVGRALKTVRSDLERVEENLPQRLEDLRTEQQREEVRRGLQRDRRLFGVVEDDYQDATDEVQRLARRIAEDDLAAEDRQKILQNTFVLRDDLLTITRGLSAVQISARVELIDLPEFELSREEAVSLALENRLDLMNQRAEVMDARRKVEVAANALEAPVDVVVEGDVRTRPGNRPLDFRGDLSSFQAGLEVTAPLDQIAERNDYRAALIDYQRARRDYMRLEDQVKFQIREAYRQIEVLRGNFEIARQALRFAALQLDQTIEEGRAPVDPGESRSAGTQGLNLLNALQDVLSSQNDLIGIWVDYERNRLNIYRDMGIMRIDERGLWDDSLYQQAPAEEGGEPAGQEIPPAPAARPSGRQWQPTSKNTHRESLPDVSCRLSVPPMFVRTAA